MGCFWGRRIFWRAPRPRRRDHRRRLHGRLHAEPDLRGDLPGRTGHAEAVLVAYDPSVTSPGLLLKALGEPRPHAGQPAGQRRRHGIPRRSSGPRPGRRPRREGVRSSFRGRADPRGPWRDRRPGVSDGYRAVLVRRGLPPAVPPQEPERVLQPQAERAHLLIGVRQPPRADRHRPARLTAGCRARPRRPSARTTVRTQLSTFVARTPPSTVKHDGRHAGAVVAVERAHGWRTTRRGRSARRRPRATRRREHTDDEGHTPPPRPRGRRRPRSASGRPRRTRGAASRHDQASRTSTRREGHGSGTEEGVLAFMRSSTTEERAPGARARPHRPAPAPRRRGAVTNGTSFVRMPAVLPAVDGGAPPRSDRGRHLGACRMARFASTSAATSAPPIRCVTRPRPQVVGQPSHRLLTRAQDDAVDGVGRCSVAPSVRRRSRAAHGRRSGRTTSRRSRARRPWP